MNSDSVTNTCSPGPALAIIAARLDTARPLAHAHAMRPDASRPSSMCLLRSSSGPATISSSQQSYSRRVAADSSPLTRQLYDVLARKRERGYDVDWTTPVLAQAAQAIGSPSAHAPPVRMRSIIEQLRVEFTSAALAPVLDNAGHIQLVLGINPVRLMTMSDIRSAAQPLLKAVQQLAITH